MSIDLTDVAALTKALDTAKQIESIEKRIANISAIEDGTFEGRKISDVKFRLTFIQNGYVFEENLPRRLRTAFIRMVTDDLRRQQSLLRAELERMK